MEDNNLNNIYIAPLLSNNSILVIYRSCGIEIAVKINRENKTMSAEKKLTDIEVKFIKENYL